MQSLAFMDSIMIYNAKKYGQIVFDDISHNCNRFRRPLIIRCIYDNEFNVRIIAFGILKDETKDSFIWWN